MYTWHRRPLQEIEAVLNEVAQAEADSLCEAIVAAQSIVVFGAGRVGMACRGFAMRLAHLGIRAHALGDATVPAIASDDMLLIASGSGETPSVKLIAETGLRNGCHLALITARRKSSIASIASTVVVIPAPSKGGGEALVISTQPLTTLYEQCLSLFFDSFVLQLMSRLGQTNDQMWARHSNLE